jgi:hypothetical protein
MEEGKSLINIGELSKPATVLIEKISEAVGGIFRPYQIRRVAKAEADAEEIKAVSKIEVTDLQRRAMRRFLEEEGKKQENIESITSKALPNVDESSTPEKIENDWLTNFFDKCRLISDEEMQNLWARVLAGEANKPGKFSKRTLSVLSSLDKSDATLFQRLCPFTWVVDDVLFPAIYEEDKTFYDDFGIMFSSIKHLTEIGLVSHTDSSSFALKKFFSLNKLERNVDASYYDSRFSIKFRWAKNNEMNLGNVLFSKVGVDLAQLCDSQPVPRCKEFVIKKWKTFGLKVVASNEEQL